ncbi:MAG: hypothetical protein SVR81_02975, partial [Chloroflexota bacterium]|nr:hypothetical protein [Chloroflexota bacterium]
MKIDINTLSLFFSLTIFLAVLVLYIQRQTDKDMPGVSWWILSNVLIGCYFLLIYAHAYLPTTLLHYIFGNTFLVTSSLALFHGMLHFFDTLKKRNHALLFFGIYFLVTGIGYTFGNIIIPNAVSSILVATFSLMSAITVRKYTSDKNKLFSNFISTTFAINAIFFLLFSLFWILQPGGQVPTELT